MTTAIALLLATYVAAGVFAFVMWLGGLWITGSEALERAGTK